MAGITRRLLKSMGLNEEQEDQIIEAHLSVVDALKEERDSLKTEAEKSKRLQTRVEELEAIANGDTENPYKAKYEKLEAEHEKLKNEYDSYKAEIEHMNALNSKKDAFRQLLKEIGISEKRIDTIVRATPDLDEIVNLDKEGAIKDKDKLSDKVRGEWADFIVTSDDRKSAPETPPVNAGNAGPTHEKRAARIAAEYRNKHYGNPIPENVQGASNTNTNNNK